MHRCRHPPRDVRELFIKIIPRPEYPLGHSLCQGTFEGGVRCIYQLVGY